MIMINRTFKFYGKAFSNTEAVTVTVTATFNGQQIYTGTVPTTINSAPGFIKDDPTFLFESTVETELAGLVPLSITVSGGTVFFGKVQANYSGVDFDIDKTDPDNHVVVVVTAPETFWGPVSEITESSDGKLDVFIDNVKQERNLADFPEAVGDWHYRIPNLGTFTCNIFVDPDLIVTRAPTIEELAADPPENTD
jgi:hypothetical protein